MLVPLKPRVSIVLLNYNGAANTIECLNSLRAVLYANFNIVIVDNLSSDNSFEQIEGYLESNGFQFVSFNSPGKAMERPDTSFVVLIQAQSNRGYGHGNNLGIHYALKNSSDYVLILNNDTVVAPDFLEPLIEVCENDRSIGVASGKIYFYDRPDFIWFNGGRFHLSTARLEVFGFNRKDIESDSCRESTFISGCFWFIPRKIFENVGYINEEYFMYLEDLEFSQRVLRAGYKLKVVRDSHVWHKVGASTGGRFSVFSVYWRTKNMVKFISEGEQKTLAKIFALIIYNAKVSLDLIRVFKLSLILIQIKAIWAAVFKTEAIHVA